MARVTRKFTCANIQDRSDSQIARQRAIFVSENQFSPIIGNLEYMYLSRIERKFVFQKIEKDSVSHRLTTRFYGIETAINIEMELIVRAVSSF